MSVSSLLSPNNLDIYARTIVTSGDHPSGSLQIGPNASASGSKSIAIGNTAVSSGSESIALGNSSSSAGINSIAFGQGAASTADYDITLGNGLIAGTGIIQFAGLEPTSTAVLNDYTHNLPVNINGTIYYLKMNTGA